jgi:hypothetical protein
MCIMFVNANCETKLFEIESYSRGIEEITNNILNDNLTVKNIPIGLVVNEVIVSPNEFYLNSCDSPAGTNNPTRYIIPYNTTKLELSFIYMLSYYLSFVYFNHPKSIKLPAPLHMTMIMNAKSIQYLRSNQKGFLPGIAL